MTTADADAKLLADCRCSLGEGIFWDGRRRRLFWFDINNKTMWSCAADGGGLRSAQLSKRISAAASAADGNFIAAADNGFGIFNPDTGAFSEWRDVEAGMSANRTNDGRADMHGAFWFGTMNFDAQTVSGAIYRALPSGEVQKKMDDVAIPNAICFSPPGDVMYWTDTPHRVIWKCALSPDGKMGAREVFVEMADDSGNPDGAVVDAEGFLWNAEYDGWRVVRYAPDGSVDRIINVPVSRPTCPIIVGGDSPKVYIVTANQNLTEDELKNQPQAGGVFVADSPAPPVTTPLL